MSETGSETRELYEPEKGETEVRNPMWFIELNFERVRAGTRALERELARSARSLSDNVGLDAKFTAEVFRQIIHRLILLLIEAGLLSLVRQLIPPQTARIHPLPVPKPIP
jgi:hypothetical protein